MNCTVRSESLQKAIGLTSSIGTRQVSLPVLTSYLITVSDQGLEIRSTNLAVGIAAAMPATVEKIGACLVESALLQGAVAGLDPKSQITLSVSEGTLSIKSQDIQLSLRISKNIDEYPTLPRPHADFSAEVPVELLNTMIKSVVFSASTSDIKPEIASVYMYAQNEEIVSVATDSFRLAEKREAYPGLEDFPGVLIPVRNAIEISKVLTRLSGHVRFEVSDHQVTLISEDLVCVSRLQEGSFPAYQGIIPEVFSTEAIVLKKDIDKALKTGRVFSDALFKLSLSVLPEQKTMIFTSENPETGESIVRLAAALSGDDVHVVVNERYLAEIVSLLQSDSIVLQFSENKPVIVRGVGDGSFLGLIMPMRL